ncbi:MAG: DUF433 domain-containing protein [Blastocatellia bacterium]
MVLLFHLWYFGLMKLQDIPSTVRHHFDQTPDIFGGKLRIRGTRISVEQVLELLEAGVGPKEIVQSFPSLTEQDITAIERLAAYFALTMLQSA